MLKVWGDRKDGDKEDQLYMMLEEEQGEICVRLVDKKGDKLQDGVVLVFSNRYRCVIITDNLNEKAPLKTDVYGQVLTLTETEIKDIQTRSIKVVFAEPREEESKKPPCH